MKGLLWDVHQQNFRTRNSSQQLQQQHLKPKQKGTQWHLRGEKKARQSRYSNQTLFKQKNILDFLAVKIHVCQLHLQESPAPSWASRSRALAGGAQGVCWVRVLRGAGEADGWGEGFEVCRLWHALIEQMECITISYDRNDLWNDLAAPAKQQHGMTETSFYDNQSPPTS